ncbi:MAG: hypothetical protein JW841_05145 [Deltaproteobacteria bacterium]|nr:hypothetical protein [Deltaproteobacteria bacterium]
MDNPFFDKMQTCRTVLKRTRSKSDLPDVVLYLENVSGLPKRKVLDTQGKEHLIDDAVLQSQYKFATGSQAKEYISKHWSKIVAEMKKSAPKSSKS